MKFKRTIGVFTAAVMMLPSYGAFAKEGVVSVNGETADVGETVLVSDRTMAEADKLMNALGVEYEEKNNVITAKFNGAVAEAETKEIDGKKYLPLRAVVEDLGGSVYWNAETGSISVKLALTEEGVFNKHYYRIASGGKSLDIVDGGLVMSDESSEASQWWMLTKKSDGYYTFINKSNGNSPDVPSGSTDAGKGLIQYAANNNDNQHFGIILNEDGSSYITVKHSKLYLTVTDGGITQEEFTGEDNQKFNLTYLGKAEKEEREIDLSLKKAEKTPLDDKHYYKAENLGDKVKIVWKSGGLVDIIGDKTISDVMLSWNGESYDLLDKETGKVTESLTFEEAGVIENAGAYEKAPLHKMYVTIEKDGKYLTVKDGAPAFEKCDITDSSLWQLLAKGNDYYSVINKAEGKSIDVPSASTDEGKELICYAPGTGDNQRFKIVKNDEGGYTLTVKHSELYLAEKDGKLIQTENSDSFNITEKGESDAKTMGVTAMPFLIEGEEYLTNIKVQWNDAGAERYDVYRSENGGEYEFVTSLEGLSIDDYDLKIGKEYSYRVDAISGQHLIDSAVSEKAKTYQLPDIEFNEFSNIKMSGLNRPNSLTDGKTYFRLSHKGRTDGGGGFGSMVLTTSEDDVTYGNEIEVLSFEDIVNDPSTADTKIETVGFESIHYAYNKETGMLFMWAHMEANGGYGYARAAVAYGKPGERFEFNCFRPMGDDSRDMGMYVDDDNSAYIICAIHGNADLAIYKLTDDWTDVEERIIVNYGKHRELPSVLKKDGIYYLFHSGTAGWYPTQGGYNVAESMEGPWSEMREIGNTNTFSSQSGGVSHLTKDGDDALMLSYRWMWWWQDATNRNTQNRLMPITVSNGYAFFDFYDNFYYNLDSDLLIPIQKGRLLSQGKPVTATNNNAWASDANDGNYRTEWVAEKNWPESITINLEQVYSLSQMQISWRSWNSQETYYSYTVETSIDGENWTTVLDRSEGFTDYAFTVDELLGQAQYVRVNILDTTPRNENKDAYTPNMYEIKILGY